METIEIKRQYRFIDPDKERLAAAKGKFDWNEKDINADKDEDTGFVAQSNDPVEYLVDCVNTGARKAVAYQLIDLVTEEAEADSFFGGLSSEDKVGAVRYIQENTAKDALSKLLLESHESPEKAARRIEKKQKEAGAEIKDWMLDMVAKGQYPSQEAFNEKVREIHTKYDLPMPNTD